MSYVKQMRMNTYRTFILNYSMYACVHRTQTQRLGMNTFILNYSMYACVHRTDSTFRHELSVFARVLMAHSTVCVFAHWHILPCVCLPMC